jgi:phenylpropionate dioxygenase-like ring-hydroxylating dioxygenase large terminal subunit
MPDLDRSALIENRINSGILGQWYPVAKSVEVKSISPLGIEVLGEKLVLWRGDNEKVHCIKDQCPHRGAPLSFGRLHEGHISCRYHGIVVSGEGVVVSVPAVQNCAFEGQKIVRAFEVQEIYDAIFIYMPSAENAKAPRLVFPKEFLSDSWSGFLCTAVWKTNYRYALDNLADPMHGSYLHAESFTLAYGAKEDLLKVDHTENGFIVSRTEQLNENFDWTEFEIHTGTMFCFLDIPYPSAAGPGGNMRIVGFVTPINEHTCKVFFWRMREVSGIQRDSWRFLYRTELESKHWTVLEQDREILEAMSDNVRGNEKLYQHDVGVNRIRQTLLKLAKSNVDFELNIEGKS